MMGGRPILGRREHMAEPESAQPSGKRTILFVDDDLHLLISSTECLKNEGFNVIAAASPLEATVLFAKHMSEIDILITDVQMPGISGPELYSKLATEKPDLPVLFISGQLKPPVIEDKGSNQRAAFLEKPFTPDMLIQKVKEMV
jgi:DNA-binding NtrC family response regulator